MGGVSPDGRVLWLSGRYNATVYKISTAGGRLLGQVQVPGKPDGLFVWPLALSWWGHFELTRPAPSLAGSPLGTPETCGEYWSCWDSPRSTSEPPALP